MMLPVPSNSNFFDSVTPLSAVSVSRTNLSVTQDDSVIQFSSRSEMATALLLERYVPHFTLQPGVSFQVPIGANKVCDFKINNTYIEFHPLNLHHDFDDRRAYRELMAALNEIERPHTRGRIKDAIRAELSEKYYRRRKLLIRLCCDPKSELKVVQNSEELYSEVITRFGENYPAKREFLREFKNLCRRKPKD